MWPELFRIPYVDIAIHTYGLMLTLGFIAALCVAARLAEVDGLPKSKIYDLAIWLLPSALIGTKVLMLASEWPEATFKWEQGLTFNKLLSTGFYLGGFLTALAVSGILMRAWKLPWRRIADAFAPGLALGNVMGRIGCFAAGCCWGKPTASWMGVKFTEEAHRLNGVPMNVALLPTQLIEALMNLAIFAFLLWRWKKRRFPGQIILAYLMAYSGERFIVEFWRADPRSFVLGLSVSQLISACLLVIAPIFYESMKRDSDEKDCDSGYRAMAAGGLTG